MKRFRATTAATLLALTLLLAVPTLAATGRRSAPSTPASLAALQGRGWLSELACSACLTALEVTLVTSTTEPLLGIVADNPDLWAECVGVCGAAVS